MVEQNFGVDTDALASFGSTATGLAAEVGEVGTSTLTGVDSLPADAFGKIGAEVGLTAAFQQAAKAQLDGVAAASAGLSGFAKAVSDAGGAYTEQQSQAKDDINRSYQV
ncbi:MAG: type VII secretion target [Umezawaea sp.]